MNQNNQLSANNHNITNFDWSKTVFENWTKKKVQRYKNYNPMKHCEWHNIIKNNGEI